MGFAITFEVLLSPLRVTQDEDHHQKSTSPELEWAQSAGYAVGLKGYSSSSEAYVHPLKVSNDMDSEFQPPVPGFERHV